MKGQLCHLCFTVDSVSLPYDHTYQHIFQYGVDIKLRSSLLPLSVTWHNVPGGIDAVRVREPVTHFLIFHCSTKQLSVQ